MNHGGRQGCRTMNDKPVLHSIPTGRQLALPIQAEAIPSRSAFKLALLLLPPQLEGAVLRVPYPQCRRCGYTATATLSEQVHSSPRSMMPGSSSHISSLGYWNPSPFQFCYGFVSQVQVQIQNDDGPLFHNCSFWLINKLLQQVILSLRPIVAILPGKTFHPRRNSRPHFRGAEWASEAATMPNLATILRFIAL